MLFQVVLDGNESTVLVETIVCSPSLINLELAETGRHVLEVLGTDFNSCI